MTRRRRIRRWLSAWRRLLAFGKMLQDLHEQGFTLITWAAHGAQVRVQSVEGLRQPPVVGRAAGHAQEGGEVKVFLDDKEIGAWEGDGEKATVIPIAQAKGAFANEVPPDPPPPGPEAPPRPPDHRPVA